MTDQSDRRAPITARVIEIDAADEIARPRPIGPQVIATERTEPVTPTERSVVVAAPPPVRRRDGVITFGLASVAVFFVGWLAVDAAAWISAAFERSAPLGVMAAVAISAGVAGAGAVIARELGSLFRLKNVETIHRRFADQHVAPADARRAIADVLAVVPRERETAAAIESFQRQVQLHHSTAQQIEILSRTVMKPLDHRAEAHVRTAVLRAFGITAISPTALTDAVFFLACGVRMVRGIAASYGHRPTAATTIHLLRRLVLEAGKLGAVDIASASLVQHLGGAVTERLATSAADALYASYRMARLGIIVMDLCSTDSVPGKRCSERDVAGRQRGPAPLGSPTRLSGRRPYGGPSSRLADLTGDAWSLTVAAGTRRVPHGRLIGKTFCNLSSGIELIGWDVTKGITMNMAYTHTGSAAEPAKAAARETSSDEMLIERIAQGDQLAMRTLFGRHRVALYRWLLRLVRDEALAEDLLSDVFLDVWRQAAAFEARSSVSTWLLAIARYKALSARRRRTDAELDDKVAATVADPADNPEVVLEKKDRAVQLRQSLASLSPEHGEVIDLVYYHDKSVKEVAEIVGVAEATVKTRMFYARRKLAEMVGAA